MYSNKNNHETKLIKNNDNSINYNSLKNTNCSISSDGSLVGSIHYMKKQKKTPITQLYRINNLSMIEIVENDEFIKCCEIEINNQVEEMKPDLSTVLPTSTVSLLSLHSTPLFLCNSLSPSLSSSELHLIAYGGNAGLVRIHLFHQLLLHPRIQVFQNQQINFNENIE